MGLQESVGEDDFRAFFDASMNVPAGSAVFWSTTEFAGMPGFMVQAYAPQSLDNPWGEWLVGKVHVRPHRHQSPVRNGRRFTCLMLRLQMELIAAGAGWVELADLIGERPVHFCGWVEPGGDA